MQFGRCSEERDKVLLGKGLSSSCLELGTSVPWHLTRNDDGGFLPVGSVGHEKLLQRLVDRFRGAIIVPTCKNSQSNTKQTSYLFILGKSAAIFPRTEALTRDLH
eukprot:6278270-Amphidinium_carterae.1